jgi:DNA recombination protein RmuC
MVEIIPLIVSVLFGLLLGAGFVWILSRERLRSIEHRVKAEVEGERAAVVERLAATEQQLQQAIQTIRRQDELNQHLQTELTVEKERRSAAEERSARLPKIEEALTASREEVRLLGIGKARLITELEARIKGEEERKGNHLQLTAQFENLANTILENKTRIFTEQNKSNLNSLLGPLGERIKDFEQKVRDSYDNESRERFSLKNEITNIAQLNTKLHQEAINLTNALKGQTKTQGTWGELILDRVLEASGLMRGREYDAQVVEIDEAGRRMQPDVIVHLGDDRHLIVDAKVNLKAYELYCTTSSHIERDSAGKAHLQAFRRHIDQLSRKDYQARFQLNSVDYVLMFVPIEPAYTLAVELDSTVFDTALEKKIVIVTPSTLHATLRTVGQMWRHEFQNKYAMEIAKKSGALYDKFVGFVNDLSVVGKRIQEAKDSYEKAITNSQLARPVSSARRRL